MYSIKEDHYAQELIQNQEFDGDSLEVQDGIFLLREAGVKRVFNDYSQNQFKFMPTTKELGLFNVCVTLFPKRLHIVLQTQR